MRTTLVLLILIAKFATADTNETSRTSNKTYVNNTYKSQRTLNKDNPDILILPGLKANRITKELHVIAEATGLKEGETAEYFLIAENSGHDYEALAISFALPSDIRKALIFIGMSPGRPVNYKKMQFWPKGERVKISFCKALTPNSRADPIKKLTPNSRADPIKKDPAEKLVKNTTTGKSIPESGFVFTGSIEVTSTTNSELKALAADMLDPMSIAANYNEPDSILDLPRLVKQSDVYDNQVISSSYSFKLGELLDIIIEPEYKDGKTRIRDLNLKINWLPETTNSNGNLVFNLSNKEKVLLSKASLTELLEEFKKVLNSGHDPFLTINFADNLPLQAANKICSILGVLDSEKGIRIEPPIKDQLYYKSFIPETYLRDRKNRVPIKWEIHIKLDDGKVEYSLINIDPQWKDNEITPALNLTNYSIQDSETIIKLLQSKEVGIPVILVFAEPEITYKQLMHIVKPVIPIYAIVHVFVEDNSPTAVDK